MARVVITRSTARESTSSTKLKPFRGLRRGDTKLAFSIILGRHPSGPLRQLPGSTPNLLRLLYFINKSHRPGVPNHSTSKWQYSVALEPQSRYAITNTTLTGPESRRR